MYISLVFVDNYYIFHQEIPRKEKLSNFKNSRYKSS